MNINEKDRLIRPDFRGVLKDAEFDDNLKELEVSAFSSAVRKTVSVSVTLVLISLVTVAIVVWVSIFDGNLGLYGNATLVFMIKVFEVLFNLVAGALTDWENWKFVEQYYNSYLLKQFLFSFVNSYWAFLYLAIKQRHTEAGCPESGCLQLIRKQLSISLVILCCMSIVQVVSQSARVRFSLWWEERTLKKTLGVDEAPKRSFVEEQAMYADFNSTEHVRAMMQLVISLGYVILFGGIAPITIPFCFAVFAVSLRSNALMFLTTTRRPMDFHQYGIGRWRDVLNTLMRTGVVFAALLFAIYGNLLKGQLVVTKFTFGAIFCFAIVLLWGAVDFMLPVNTHTALIMAARRKRVFHKIMEHLEDAAGHKERREGSVSVGLKRHKTRTSLAITSGHWEQIKTAADVVEAEEKSPRSQQRSPEAVTR